MQQFKKVFLHLRINCFSSIECFCDFSVTKSAFEDLAEGYLDTCIHIQRLKWETSFEINLEQSYKKSKISKADRYTKESNLPGNF